MALTILYSIIAIFCIFLIVVIFLKSNERVQNIGIFILTCLFIGSLITIVIINFEKNNPKAIDVYRNKTELKISGYYNDSCFVPTDSIVIFKN